MEWTPRKYAKKLKTNGYWREKTRTKHIRKLKRIKKELNAMEPDEDEFPLYRAGFHEALNKALTKIDEVLNGTAYHIKNQYGYAALKLLFIKRGEQCQWTPRKLRQAN